MTILIEDFGDIPLGPGPWPSDAAAARALPRSTTFLAEVAAAEQQAPLPPAPPPAPDPNDPRYAGAPQAYAADKQAADALAASFAAAAKVRAGAVGQVFSRWLANAPLVMLQELLDQPRAVLPIFKPIVGPVVVFRHDHVMTCLERTDLFTVDPYAPEMARAADDRTKRPDAFSHFLLGTDRDDLYRLDDVILRHAVSRKDEAVLSALCRHEAERQTALARESGRGEIDVAETLAKLVPLRVVGDYLGVHWHDRGAPSALPGLKGGDSFPLDDDLLAVFTFSKIQEGIVPTADDLFGWVKDAFRNAFNNFIPAHPLFPVFRERGIVATEHLTAYVHALIKHYKACLLRGDVVPDSMLTRLLRMQLQLSTGDGAALERDLAAVFGGPIPEGELPRRLSDSMIRSNVFAAAVGALVNPQEATARIADGMLQLKDGQIIGAPGSTYEEAARLAQVEETDPAYADSLQKLRKFALEALRLCPQGEVLLRVCVQDTTVLAGVPIRKGTPVFVGYAGAMRDPEAIDRPLTFDITRDEKAVEYLANRERAREAPQSQVFLQHGYGRHKCLGRYASEITMRESLRALLRLGSLERRSALELDEQKLYAAHLRITFS